MVKQNFRTKMRNQNAEARMEDPFKDYHTLLNRNGLLWLIYDNPKVAVQHVISAIRPQTLFYRLASNLAFKRYVLPNDLKGFLTHEIEIAKAFQLVDASPTVRTSGTAGQHNHGGRRNGGRMYR